MIVHKKKRAGSRLHESQYKVLHTAAEFQTSLSFFFYPIFPFCAVRDLKVYCKNKTNKNNLS